ncbi:unnamed protein product, partial [Porites evermanni]
SKPDCSELEAIKYHAGWAVKRTRDIIKASAEASNPLLLKKSLRHDSEVGVDPHCKVQWYLLIALLGKDEQVGEAAGAGSDTSRYNFIVADEVAPFFVLLHDFTQEYLSQSDLQTHGDKIVIACLKAMSASCEIREAWKGICRRKFLTEKGSLSLRQDLKSKTSKKSTCTKSESEATKTPAAIEELVKHFADPEITVRCLVEISKGNDPEGDLNHLTRKHLTKLLKAFGLPALEGKKKSRQISAILSHL